ncbi:TolC family protein [Hymenobacter norwichensis]|uniref:TolC family protein n=1 Tax=Hymenobacter norwichensis TaxID=223903 RepID=UPI0003B57EA8|nr:TolC family protein [Hymenobacter norwichensis]
MNPTATLLPRTLPLAGALALLLGAAGPVSAQTTPPTQPPAGTLAASQVATGPWTLQRAIDYALENNLTVRQNQLTAENGGAILRQSKAALLPTANLNGTQTWNYGQGVNPLTFAFQNQTTRSNNFSGSTQVTLFQGFQLRNTIKRNTLDYQASLGDIQKSRNDLSLNIASQFLQLVLAEELIRSNQTRLNSTQQQVERTQKLLKAGSVAESNLLDSQAQLASDELSVITAQNQRDIARLQLMQLMNLDEASQGGFQIQVPELADPDEQAPLSEDPATTYQTALTLLPEIKTAELRVRSAEATVDVARGAYLPRLVFGGSVFTGYSSARTVTSVGNDSTARKTTFFVEQPGGGPIIPLNVLLYQRNTTTLSPNYWDQIDQNLGRQLQFSLNIPILNGLQVRTNVQRSLIGVQQARLNAEQVRLTLRQSIQQAYADALAAQRQFGASRRQVEALTTAYRNAEIRFNNGLLNGTEFNIAKNNLATAESTMIQNKYQFIFRRKVLDFYQGRPLAL